MSLLAPDTTLEVARDWLRSRLKHGVTCPTCQQDAKIYRRSINSRQAVALIKLHNAVGRDWGHVPTIAGDGCEISKLRFWGLVEEEKDKRPDGGRTGFWRVTDLGEGFVRGRWPVAKSVLIYNNRCLEVLGRKVDIRECLGNRFDYSALMAGRG